MNKNISNGQEETENLKVMLRNLGTVNRNEVTIELESNKITLWFSYETVVSFVVYAEKYFDRATIKNYWSTTTGKLLNEREPDKDKRLEEEIWFF